MRNLSSLWTATSSLPPTHPDHSITASTFDADEDVLYVASEVVHELDVHIELWRVTDDVLENVTSTISPAVDGADAQVVLLVVLPDTRDLCLITRAGDITTIALPPAAAVASVVGTVSPGILAAALAPDASLLVLVSTAPAIILMATPDLDVLSEGPLHTTATGAAQPVTAGWGTKATQFHGSLGKTAAQAPAPARSTTSPDDDAAPRIAWRGDAQFFAVSAREGARRVLRVYDRLGTLQNTAEDVPGLEHALAWRPSGALLASTQRFGSVPRLDAAEWSLGPGRDGRHDVVFFERNGLRHGEFTLRERVGSEAAGRVWGYRVRELAWNADSSVLAVWLERDAGDVVQLWTTGNYHWYLKLEIPAAPRLTNIAWHAEDPARLILTSPKTVQDMRLTRYTAASPLDSGLVAVVDGAHILLTPFRTQNVPPPMSAHRLALPPSSPPPSHIAFAPAGDADAMAVLFPDATAALYTVPHLPATPVLVWQGPVPARARQISVRSRTMFGVLCDQDGADVLCTVDLGEEEVVRGEVRWPGSRGRMVDSLNVEDGAWAWQGSDGALYEVPYDADDAVPRPTAHLPAFSTSATRLSSTVYIGLSGTTLTATTLPTPLSRACTSYAVAPPFLLYTTTAPAHEIAFVPLTDLHAAPLAAPETRKIERGARIVVALPPAMRVVLQLPRGNLETIMPRPMVLAHIRRHVILGEYGEAFRAARTHRVDLDVLITVDPAQFGESVRDVVEQIGDVENLCLFLASLGRSTLPSDQIGVLCDSLRAELERRGVREFVRPILTAFVVKRPMDCEGALGVLGKLRAEDPALVEDAVKYIVFLVDAETLFNTALGMYDFEMVLLVAQHAQKDPREYLPFLRRLRAYPGAYQHFAIDDHLKRHAKALRSLHAAGPSYFEEARAYVVKHRLFEEAVALWDGKEREAMLEVYGDYLFEGREFGKAGLAFVQAKCIRKAMVAYEKALDWQAQFDLAVGEGIEGEELVATARRVADDLATKRRHADAARVLLDYAGDVDEAVAALVRGGEWAEVRRIISLRKRADLVSTLLVPGALDARASLGEEVAEIDELRTKQVARLDELKAKKEEEPDAFYGVEDIGLANVDTMTDVSNPGTMFTRYTVAPSASSNRSRRTSRSKRKLDRKAGRKGTVEEEEYLLKSVTKLIARLEAVLAEARTLLPQLLFLSGEHAAEGQELEDEIGALDGALRRDVARIWDERAAEEGTGSSLVEKVPRPVFSDVAWRVGWVSGVHVGT